MPIDYRTQSPRILLDFLAYHETIKAHSQRTVDEYFLDMRNFFRYMKWIRDPALRGKDLDEIDIMDVDLAFVSTITLSDKGNSNTTGKRIRWVLAVFCLNSSI